MVASPYLVWSILQGQVEIQLARFTNGSVVTADVVTLLWQPRAQFWFLYELFFISAIALLVYRLLPVRWQPVLACLAYLHGDSLPGGIPLVFVIQYAPYFACGVVFGRMANGTVSLRPGWVTAAAVTLVVIAQSICLGPFGFKPDARWSHLALAMVSIVAVVA